VVQVRRSSWWRKQIVDVLRLALLVERAGGGRHQDFSLTAVADRLGVPVERPHHALDDALTTAEVFLVLQPELEGRGITTPRRLLRVSRG
jgi:DNA polymerase-3 subunit epsilon